MPSPTIVFDLDGTLIDTAPDLIGTLNVILARHDVKAVAFDQARSMIGAGVKPLLERALSTRGIALAPHDRTLRRKRRSRRHGRGFNDRCRNRTQRGRAGDRGRFRLY